MEKNSDTGLDKKNTKDIHWYENKMYNIVDYCQHFLSHSGGAANFKIISHENIKISYQIHINHVIKSKTDWSVFLIQLSDWKMFMVNNYTAH